MPLQWSGSPVFAFKIGKRHPIYFERRRSVVRTVGYALAKSVVRKRGDICLTFVSFQTPIRTAPVHVLQLSGAILGLYSRSFLLLLCGSCWLLQIGGLERSVRRAYSFAGVDDSNSLRVAYSCKFGIQFSCCRAVSSASRVLVCVLVVWPCRSWCHEPSVGISELQIDASVVLHPMAVVLPVVGNLSDTSMSGQMAGALLSRKNWSYCYLRCKNVFIPSGEASSLSLFFSSCWMLIGNRKVWMKCAALSWNNRLAKTSRRYKKSEKVSNLGSYLVWSHFYPVTSFRSSLVNSFLIMDKTSVYVVSVDINSDW